MNREYNFYHVQVNNYASASGLLSEDCVLNIPFPRLVYTTCRKTKYAHPTTPRPFLLPTSTGYPATALPPPHTPGNTAHVSKSRRYDSANKTTSKESTSRELKQKYNLTINSGFQKGLLRTIFSVVVSM